MLRQVQVVAPKLALAVALAAALALTAGGCRRESVEAPAPKPRAAANAGSAAVAPGPEKSSPEFHVRLAVAEAVSPGKDAQATVTITAREGYKVNSEYPAHFKVEGSSAGLRFERERFDAREGAEKTPCPGKPEDSCELKARIPFKASEPGSQRLSGVLAFSVCNPDSCLIEKARLELPVEVR